MQPSRFPGPLPFLSAAARSSASPPGNAERLSPRLAPVRIAFLAGAAATVTFLAAADFAATFFVATFGVVTFTTFLTVVPSVVFLLSSLFAVTFLAAAFFVGLVAPGSGTVEKRDHAAHGPPMIVLHCS